MTEPGSASSDEHAFSPKVSDIGGANLKARASRGAIVNVASASTQLVAVAILARMLSPHEFGSVWMVLSLIAFVSVFSEMGLSAFTLHEKDLTQAQLSTLFWINTALGIVAAAAIAAASPLVAWFYDKPELQRLAMLAGLAFVPAGIGAQHQALLTRRMRMARLAGVQAGGIIVGGTVAVLMARYGFGPYSLVGQAVAAQSAVTFLAWTLGGWMPGLPDFRCGVGRMVGFGGNVAGMNLANYFYRNLDKILLGRAWGKASVGFYGQAYKMMSLPVMLIANPLARVLTPTLVNLQDDLPMLRSAYLKALEFVAFVTFPMMLGLAAVAGDAVRLILGDQWGPSVPALRFLCVAGMCQAVSYSTGCVFTAVGRPDRALRMAVVHGLALSAGMVIGLKLGAAGVAAGILVMSLVVIVPCLAYTGATISLDTRSILRSIAGPLAASTVMAGLTYGVGVLVADRILWQGRLAICVVSGVAAYLPLMAVFRPRLATEFMAAVRTGIFCRR